MHPIEILQGYRLGGHRATVELQKPGSPTIHIDFDVLGLVDDIRERRVSAVILTGTAGDGKTYLAYRVIRALGLQRAAVAATQSQGGYDRGGIYVDLDLSAGPLKEERARRLHQVLGNPGALTLVCANEGKLSELEERWHSMGLAVPDTPLRINLSERALVSEAAWGKVLTGVLNAPFWEQVELPETDIVARNHVWMQEPIVEEHIRRYLLLPYLLGEPITIREALSFMAYALSGDLTPQEAKKISEGKRDPLPYFTFNTLFSEPEGYVHGGRAIPAEKLLWWLFRFDPAATADPETDLRLLTHLDELNEAPPAELMDYWHNELAIQPDEKSDTRYRKRVATYMTYARRWYALSSESGNQAYFPFRYFDDYLEALMTPSEDLEDSIDTLIRGLNLLLSGGQVRNPYNLNLYYMGHPDAARAAPIYSHTQVPSEDFRLVSDVTPESEASDPYLERHPRRLVLCYPSEGDQLIRLPISLLLYEVLMGAASPEGGFAATLWSKERHTVARFMGALNQRVRKPAVAQFVIALDNGSTLNLAHNPKKQRITIS